MNCKKLSLIVTAFIFVFLASHTIFAQSFHLKGGPSFSKMIVIDEGEKIFTSGAEGDDEYSLNKFMPTFNAAATYNFRLSQALRLETGLLFSAKGTRVYEYNKNDFSGGQYIYTTDARFRMFSVDLPVLLKINFLNKDKFTGYGIVGGTIGLTLLGRSTITGNSEETYTDTEINTSYVNRYGLDLGKTDDRLNAGPMIGAGMEFGRYFFECNYGVAFFSPMWWDANTVYNHNLHFSLGLKFNRPEKEKS